jgi:hypothetical protein
MARETWRGMSLFPAFVSARKRQQEQAPAPEPAAEEAFAEPSHDDDNDIFGLLPPQPDAAGQQEPEPLPPPEPIGRNHHPVDMTDLSRLSIDREGRLYWDGKAVETHHRFAMSRQQVIGASIVAAFVMIGAIGAALQGSAAARDWACRLGWSASVCAMPNVQPHTGADIPA